MHTRVELTWFELLRLLEALSSGSQRSEDQQLFMKLIAAKERLNGKARRNQPDRRPQE